MYIKWIWKPQNGCKQSLTQSSMPTKKESRSFERLSINRLSYNKLLAQCTSNVHCDNPTSWALLIFIAHLPSGCCLRRVMAAFVVNVNKFPFTHLRITCPMPRKPIISTCAGTDARVSAKETCLLC